MTEEAITRFLQLGVGYVIAFTSMIVNVFLFKKLEDKDKVIDNRDVVIAALQEKRVIEADKRGEIVQNIMTSVANPISKILELQQTFTRFIENYTWEKK